MDRYKYLGVILNECLEFDITASTLADTVSRRLLNDLDFKTFEKLYTIGVIPIIHGFEAWDFQLFMDLKSGIFRLQLAEGIQNRIILYLGLHNVIPLTVLRNDFTEIRQSQCNCCSELRTLHQNAKTNQLFCVKITGNFDLFTET